MFSNLGQCTHLLTLVWAEVLGVDISQYTTLHFTTLQYTTIHYTTLHFTTLHYLMFNSVSENLVIPQRTELKVQVFRNFIILYFLHLGLKDSFNATYQCSRVFPHKP